MLNEVHRIPVSAWGFSESAPDSSDDGRTSKRILLAATDSKACTRAVAVVAGLARGSGSEVCVLHLIERRFLGRAGWYSIETTNEAKQLLERFRAELETLGVRVVARTGRARREERAIDILLAAAQFRADVIVIGTRRKSSLRAVLFGSVSHDIIHRSKIPVVVVP
ncbi:MAG TPA: universal stress protein [Candidatus Acidoferrum sp.]|jgi:nucleotide-binding universal stress UspA family protein|nr:universal stress protein [Candidatus Acidoferrum sp.]